MERPNAMNKTPIKPLLVFTLILLPIFADGGIFSLIFAKLTALQEWKFLTLIDFYRFLSATSPHYWKLKLSLIVAVLVSITKVSVLNND